MPGVARYLAACLRELPPLLWDSWFRRSKYILSASYSMNYEIIALTVPSLRFGLLLEGCMLEA
jgi:hypothetical protein